MVLGRYFFHWTIWKIGRFQLVIASFQGQGVFFVVGIHWQHLGSKNQPKDTVNEQLAGWKIPHLSWYIPSKIGGGFSSQQFVGRSKTLTYKFHFQLSRPQTTRKNGSWNTVVATIRTFQDHLRQWFAVLKRWDVGERSKPNDPTVRANIIVSKETTIQSCNTVDGKNPAITSWGW